MKKKFHHKWNRKGPPDCALGEGKRHVPGFRQTSPGGEVGTRSV